VAKNLTGKRVAFVVAPEGTEQVELTEPWKAVKQAGGQPELVSTAPGKVHDAVVLPGGVANPDFLRTNPNAVRFVRDFFAQQKPVAAICHAPWTLIEADVVRGRRMTSWPSLQTDLRNAGAEWVDEQVVVDNGLVTSRKPDDLPAFCGKVIEEIAEGKHKAQAASA
jgi:protease I